jgi:carboxymethylenebutenolidase
MSEKVTLKVSDGSEMSAYVAKPSGSPQAGLIVIQEAFGITQHIQRVADRFAKEGYLVISPELFHHTAPPGFTVGYTEFDLVKAHYGALTLPGLEADMKACFGWLKDNGVQKIGSVGYCLGGRVSYVANSVLHLNAAVSYYGRIAPDLLERAKDQHGPLLLFWGGSDKGIPPADAQSAVNALRAAGKPFTNVEFSEAGHGFNCDDRPGSFHAESSEQAWGMTLAFFKKHLLSK